MQRQHSSQATSTLGNTPNLNIGFLHPPEGGASVGQNPGKISENPGKKSREIWEKSVKTFAKPLKICANSLKIQAKWHPACCVLKKWRPKSHEDVFWRSYKIRSSCNAQKMAQKNFGQVWGNSGKTSSHPQKCACSYIYDINGILYVTLYRYS